MTAFRPEPQTLLTVNARNVSGNARAERRLSRGSLSFARRDDVAHDDFVEALNGRARAAQRLADDDARQAGQR